MNVILGSGKKWQTFVLPSVAAAKADPALREELERAGEVLKTVYTRPKLLATMATR